MCAQYPPAEVRLITAAETLPLRLEVLRPGRPIEAAHFTGDDAPGTRHFGVFRGTELVGIASLFESALPQMPHSRGNRCHYQLRGMAVAPQLQKAGYGGDLLHACP